MPIQGWKGQRKTEGCENGHFSERDARDQRVDKGRMSSEVRAGVLSISVKWSHSQGPLFKVQVGEDGRVMGFEALTAAQGSSRPLQCQLSSPPSSPLSQGLLFIDGRTEPTGQGSCFGQPESKWQHPGLP